MYLHYCFAFQGVIRLYDIPDNTFESEESSDEDSGGDDGDGAISIIFKL